MNKTSRSTSVLVFQIIEKCCSGEYPNDQFISIVWESDNVAWSFIPGKRGLNKMREKVNCMHVLVVEDNVINQKIMRAFLRKLGHECTIANNGAEALDLYWIGFDCILMDIQMPVMDGIRATSLIRKLDQENGMHTPIIAVTASSPYKDQHLFLEVGMDDYMPKPIGMKDLQMLMNNVLSGKYGIKK